MIKIYRRLSNMSGKAGLNVNKILSQQFNLIGRYSMKIEDEMQSSEEILDKLHEGHYGQGKCKC